MKGVVHKMMSSFKEEQQVFTTEMMEWDMKQAADEEEERQREEREEERERLYVEMEEAREQRRTCANEEHEMRMMGMLGQLLTQFHQPHTSDIQVENNFYFSCLHAKLKPPDSKTVCQ